MYLWTLPFSLIGLIVIIYSWVKFTRADRREKSRMDSAEIMHRDEFFEENPWRAK